MHCIIIFEKTNFKTCLPPLFHSLCLIIIWTKMNKCFPRLYKIYPATGFLKKNLNQRSNFYCFNEWSRLDLKLKNLGTHNMVKVSFIKTKKKLSVLHYNNMVLITLYKAKNSSLIKISSIFVMWTWIAVLWNKYKSK